MKIDYELVEKIGATHYRECNDGVDLYKVDGNELKCFTQNKSAAWESSIYSTLVIMTHVKPIPPKPQVRVEYEKVTEFTFDLKGEFERGELFFQHSSGWDVINDNEMFLTRMFENRVHRRIEKPVDWRIDALDYINKNSDYNAFDAIGAIINDRSDLFLEMCRIALRANGEL